MDTNIEKHKRKIANKTTINIWFGFQTKMRIPEYRFPIHNIIFISFNNYIENIKYKYMIHLCPIAQKWIKIITGLLIVIKNNIRYYKQLII